MPYQNPLRRVFYLPLKLMQQLKIVRFTWGRKERQNAGKENEKTKTQKAHPLGWALHLFDAW
ncbi:hypothetical protein C9E85_15740, partial [Plesiomonas shigelloides]|uniref:hypothetical protein n=1 Tax=Plesiomonas shigelloides TaxID=703 RepID=UPI000D56912E